MASVTVASSASAYDALANARVAIALMESTTKETEGAKTEGNDQAILVTSRGRDPLTEEATAQAESCLAVRDALTEVLTVRGLAKAALDELSVVQKLGVQTLCPTDARVLTLAGKLSQVNDRNTQLLEVLTAVEEIRERLTAALETFTTRGRELGESYKVLSADSSVVSKTLYETAKERIVAAAQTAQLPANLVRTYETMQNQSVFAGMTRSDDPAAVAAAAEKANAVWAAHQAALQATCEALDKEFEMPNSVCVEPVTYATVQAEATAAMVSITRATVEGELTALGSTFMNLMARDIRHSATGGKITPSMQDAEEVHGAAIDEHAAAIEELQMQARGTIHAVHKLLPEYVPADAAGDDDAAPAYEWSVAAHQDLWGRITKPELSSDGALILTSLGFDVGTYLDASAAKMDGIEKQLGKATAIIVSTNFASSEIARMRAVLNPPAAAVPLPADPEEA